MPDEFSEQVRRIIMMGVLAIGMVILLIVLSLVRG